jgi:hypothetical protein
MTSSTPAVERPALPLGRLSFGWTAPENTVSSLSFVIKDAQEQEVFSFSGSSDELEPGIFFETNNTCGGDLSCEIPGNLTAVSQEDQVLLTWDAVDNEGYGFNLYRDGLICRLIPAGTGTSFIDQQAGQGGHCYQVAVLCEGGETGLSNETCASVGPCYPPRNLDFNIVSNYRVQLNWEAPVPSDGLSGYVLYRKEGDGEYTRLKLLNANTLTYTDNALYHEGDYYYRLYAYYRIPDCYSSPANRKYYPNVFELHAYYSPTGVVETEVGVKVYPNPTYGTVKVEAESMTHVTAYNALGQCVLDQETAGDSYEWHPMEKGVFLMRIDTENGVSYTKIVAL